MRFVAFLLGRSFDRGSTELPGRYAGAALIVSD